MAQIARRMPLIFRVFGKAIIGQVGGGVCVDNKKERGKERRSVRKGKEMGEKALRGMKLYFINRSNKRRREVKLRHV